MSVLLEKFPGKTQDMLRYTCICIIFAYLQTELAIMAALYRLKKERNPSSFWGTVDYEMLVMFVNTPTGLANFPMKDHYDSSGIYFHAVWSLEPILVIISHIPSLSSLPTKRSNSNCFAFNCGSCIFNPCKFLHGC